MTVTVLTPEGTTVSTWRDVEEVQLLPSSPPVMLMLSGTLKKEISGVQALSPGMYATYQLATIM